MKDAGKAGQAIESDYGEAGDLPIGPASAAPMSEREEQYSLGVRTLTLLVVRTTTFNLQNDTLRHLPTSSFSHKATLDAMGPRDLGRSRIL